MLECVRVVLVSGSSLQTLSRSMLGHELLDTIRDPDVDNWNAAHGAEPRKSCLYISWAVVSVQPEEASDEDAPTDSFHGVLEPE